MRRENRLKLVESKQTIDVEKARFLGQEKELRKLHPSHSIYEGWRELGDVGPCICKPVDLSYQTAPSLNLASVSAIVHGYWDLRLYEYHRTTFRSDNQEFLVGFQFRDMEGNGAPKGIPTRRYDPEGARNGPGRIVGADHGAPKFEMLMWIVGVCPEDLAKSEIRLGVIAEWQLPIEILVKPLVDEHLFFRRIQL